jgi:hypothetical protein
LPKGVKQGFLHRIQGAERGHYPLESLLNAQHVFVYVAVGVLVGMGLSVMMACHKLLFGLAAL